MKKIKRNKAKDKIKSNIIPLKSKVQNVNKNFNNEENFRKEINLLAKDISNEIKSMVKNSNLHADFAYYHFLFHLKQEAIMNISYPLFKTVDKATTNEVTENLAEYLNDNSPELKLNDINKTLN